MTQAKRITWQASDIEIVVLDLVHQACSNNFQNKTDIRKFAKTRNEQGHWLLDSLSAYQAISYVSDFFQVEDQEILDAFLEAPNLDNLIQVGLFGLNQGEPTIKFHTSGSSAKPKAVKHSIHSLVDEAMQWQAMVGRPDTVYVAVPQHHIYGFIWGCLLPKLWQVQSMDVRHKVLTQISDLGKSLLVTVPALTSTFALFEKEQLDKVNLVVSTAPMDFVELRKLYGYGFNNVYQIYGSTETGGVGIRNQDNPLYQLRNDIEYIDGYIWRNAEKLPAQDNLQFLYGNRFEVNGRADAQVQINGYNVELSNILDSIKQVEGVKDAVLRVADTKTQPQLNAFVVSDGKQKEPMLREGITERCGKFLFPQNIAFGHRIPTNEMGKVLDWLVH